ncbi:MAG TPA: hypothetical protein VJW20_18440 [Candidatus Angelobacter sp.]|nr:hypothetical protein [Candidatus Angelobacter sp.]
MRRLHQIVILCALLSITLQAADQKKQTYYVKPDQAVDLSSDVKLVTAKQDCENWALAAGVETMLAKQKVALDQNFWVMHMSGGELCLDKLPSMETLTHAVNKEFVMDDGRHVRLEAHFVRGAPVNIDALIAGLRLQQVSLLLWQGHPYYLTGITYDEHIGANGTRYFEIKELRLANTYAKQPGVTFLKGRDNPGDIGGVLSVAVLPQ